MPEESGHLSGRLIFACMPETVAFSSMLIWRAIGWSDMWGVRLTGMLACSGTHMGKVLIQMAADADAEAAAPAPAPAFAWPAPPVKAAKADADAPEEEEAAAAEPVEAVEPEAKPVFFCKCAPSWMGTGVPGGHQLCWRNWDSSLPFNNRA